MPVEIQNDIINQYVPLPFSDHTPDMKGETPDSRSQSLKAIEEMIQGFQKTSLAFEMLTKGTQIDAIWEMARFITTDRLHMNDHGKIHAMVTASSAIQILEILHKTGINTDVIERGIGDLDDAYLIVLLSSLCHDIGNSIHRKEHLHHSIKLVDSILDKVLSVTYSDPFKSMQIRLFILSAINSHHGDPEPLTVEGSIVSIADASDLTKGRAGHRQDILAASIHAISTLSIDQVIITQGTSKPVEIQISLSHIAGMYQIQETLIPKIKAGMLAKYISVYIPLMNQYVY